MDRLDKILSDSGFYSRSEARGAIKAGLVRVNGAVVTEPSSKFDMACSEIIAGTHVLGKSKERYFLLNKPAGILTATRDKTQPTVVDLFSKEERSLGMVPAGRLDKDTTGFLILTTNGEFVHRLISPKKHVPKVYFARVEGALGPEDVSAFAQGIVLGDGTACLPAVLTLLPNSSCYVKVYEGKYHQVKRMLASRGATVITLHRCSIGRLSLPDNLNAGEYLEITEAQAMMALEDTPDDFHKNDE